MKPVGLLFMFLPTDLLRPEALTGAPGSNLALFVSGNSLKTLKCRTHDGGAAVPGSARVLVGLDQEICHVAPG